MRKMVNGLHKVESGLANKTLLPMGRRVTKMSSLAENLKFPEMKKGPEAMERTWQPY